MQKYIGIICKQDQMEEFTGINNVIYINQCLNRQLLLVHLVAAIKRQRHRGLPNMSITMFEHKNG